MNSSRPPEMSELAEQRLIDLLRNLWGHLPRRRRYQFFLVIAISIGSAVVEMVSLGAVIPFISVLVVPESALDNGAVARLAEFFGVSGGDRLVILLTAMFACLAIAAASIRLFVLWVGIRVTVATSIDINADVYRRTLHQPYEVHLSRNSSEVISGIVDKVESIGGGILQPIQTMVSASVLALSITVTLLLIEPVVALGCFGGFGGAYGIIIWMSRRRLNRHGVVIAGNQTRVIKNLQEGLGGIRDVLLDGTQDVFAEDYRSVDRPLRLAQGNIHFLALSPRFVMEAIGMVIIAGTAFLLSRSVDGVAGSLPVLGAIALGGQRMLPALQQIYGCWAQVSANKAMLVEAVDLLDQPLSGDEDGPPPQPRGVQSEVCFRGVSYGYGDGAPDVIDGLDLVIPAGTRVGIVGGTGSGKTTVLDLFMGLLTPTAGILEVDGQPLTGRRRREWQRAIAHVPQHIYLADATFAENIAFGVDPGGLEMERVVEAARRAKIDEFIASKEGGYQARVGERGAWLSGGQRQRIGIARAFYRSASILVLDEATSALDAVTEREVISSVHQWDVDATLLVVAHRVTTVRQCDLVVEITDGRISASGSFDEVVALSAAFRFAAKSEGVGS